jgi:hypothetical protein
VVSEDQSYPVNHHFFSLTLGPGTGTELILHVNRFAGKPSLAFPWRGDEQSR